MCEEQRGQCMRSGKANESKDEQRQKLIGSSVLHHHRTKIWAPGRQRGCEAATGMSHLLFLPSLCRGVYPGKCCFTLLTHQDQAESPDHTLANTLTDRLADPALTFRPAGPSTGSILKRAPHLPSRDLVHNVYKLSVCTRELWQL